MFPSIYIPNYKGTPVPVVDRNSGELVAILTRPQDFSESPAFPQVSVVPDENEVGLTTDDPRFDVILGGLYVDNTGFGYTDPVVEIYDKDREDFNGEAKAIVSDGRIVNIEIINTGTTFRRIPEVRITDPTGYGAVAYAVMSLIPREAGDNPTFKPGQGPVEMVFCQSKNLKNLY